MAENPIPQPGSRREAREKGLKTYFSGKPCKRGHLCERWVSTNACRECLKAFNSRWKKTNRAACAAYDRQWRKLNPEKTKRYSKQNYDRHKQQHRASGRRYAILNKERLRAKQKEWERQNPEKVKAWAALKAARRKNAVGRFTPDDIQRIYKAQSGKCAYCQVRLKNNYHIDHIVAITNGGTNWPANLQLCCQPCNYRKNDRDPMDFARITGRLL